MSGTRLPRYAERGGDQVFRQPFLLERAHLRGFLLAANGERLQELCDRCLNDPSESASGERADYRPFSDAVLLTFTTLPRISSLDERDEGFGWSAEVEATFWVPVVSTQDGRPHLSWYIPYLFVDNPYAVAAGREIYGFPKALATLGQPTDREGPEPYRVDALAIRRHGRDAKALPQRLLEIVRTEEGQGVLSKLSSLGGLLPLLVGGGGAAAAMKGALLQLENLVAKRAMPLVFLRQLRDVADAQLAAFQEIVEAPARVTTFHGGGLLQGRYELRLEPCATYPIAEDLGLSPSGQAVQAAFFLDFDFVIDRGRTLHGGAGGGPRPVTEARAPKPAAPRRKIEKVAVLGGGMGALTAVFAMTEEPGWQERFDVTVYQPGWRLGGKGASGRNLEIARRIEEHGLHIWFGAYENAFGVMRRCYEELGRPAGAPLSTWQQAFTPHDLIVLDESDGVPRRWLLDFPRNDGLPGDGAPTPSPAALLRILLGWTARELEAALRLGPAGGGPSLLSLLSQAPNLALAGLLAAAEQVEAALVDAAGPDLGALLPLELLQGARRRLQAHLLESVAKSDEARRLWILLDLNLTAMLGILKDGLLARGFDAVDGEDLREWFGRHGASALSLSSAPLRVLYDLIFAYEGGDPARPNLAAGATLYAALRMFYGYKGSIMWKMEAGMGDVVFAPLYEVLRRRGVRFRFFHRAQALKLSADGTSIERIVLARQATLRSGDYAPFVDVKGLPCWPDRPLFDQLEEGAALRAAGTGALSALETGQPGALGPAAVVELVQGVDFDAVILGIPVGAHREVCADLIAKLPAWRRMVDNVRTTATQALQLWLRPDLQQLGSPMGAGRPPVLGAYAQPLNTYADLSHLAAREDWPGRAPGHTAYFCGPLTDSGPGVADSAAALLERLPRDLWPKAGAKLGDLIVSRHERENRIGTERYVLSEKGSLRHRLRADGSGVRNLYLTGDWIDNGANLGCIEAAAMAGLQCSRAISGQPEHIAGEPERLRRVP